MVKTSVHSKYYILSALLLPLITVLLLLFSPMDAKAAADYSYVRVKLSIGAVSSYSVKVKGDYYVAESSSAQLSRQGYTVKIAGGALSLCDSGGKVMLKGKNTITFVQRVPTANSNNCMTLGSKNYLGNITFSMNSAKTALICVNRVYMEDYVAGVIPYEMGEASNINALKAQAIAARTYAANQMSSSATHDVVDTAADQVYNGYEPSKTRSLQAVKETAKQMLWCDKELVSVYYSASNGGFMDITQHIWSTSVPLEPYQVFKKDPYDLRHPSSRKEEIKLYKNLAGSNTMHSNLEKYIKDACIDLFQTSAYIKKGYQVTLYSDLNLKTIVSVTPSGLRGGHSFQPTKKCSGHSASKFGAVKDCYESCPNYIKYKVVLKVDANKVTKDAKGQEVSSMGTETVTITLDAAQFEPGGSYAIYKDDKLRLISLVDNGKYFSFMHLRFGHGIGLSQRGTQQQANEGRTHTQILSFYYPNTEIKAANIARDTASDFRVIAVGTVNVNTVNIRKDATTAENNVIGKYSKGHEVQITQLDYNAEFHQILYNGGLAYIYSDYVTVTNTSAGQEEISLSKKSLSLKTGDIAALTASASNGKAVAWKSSNKAIATVDSAGKVTAVAGGTATITAYLSENSSVSKDCTVKVTPVVTGITLDMEYPVVAAGKALQLSAAVFPSTAPNKNVTYKVSDPSIATIDGKGLLKGLKEGQTAYYGYAADGGCSAFGYITVLASEPTVRVSSVAFSKSSLTMPVGQKQTLTVSFKPANASNRYLYLYSEDSTVATVTQRGEVAAVAAGKTNIAARCIDSGKTIFCKVTVTEPMVKSISLNAKSAKFEPQETYRLKAACSPSNAADKAIKWSSSNSNIAMVNSSGLVTGKTPGTVTITAKNVKSGVKATAKITVGKPTVTAIGKVTGSNVNVRSAPSTASSVIVKMAKSAEVKIAKRNYKTGWHQIRYNNKNAYISSSYVSITAAFSKTGTIKSDNVKGYSKAATSGTALAAFAKGTSISITKQNYSSGWHQALYMNTLVYVQSGKVSIGSGGTAPSALPNAVATGTVTGSGVNIRSAPSTTSSVLGKVAKNAKVSITKKNYKAGWHQILHGKKVAYISSSYVKISSSGSASSVAKGKIRAGVVNVRANPSTASSSKVLGQLKNGAVVEISKLFYSSQWHQIRYKNKTAYIYASYVRI